MNQTLSLEVKTAVDTAISTAADHFGQLLRSLASDLATERSRSKQLAKQIVDLKSILSAQPKPTPSHKSEPTLPKGFKFSPDTNIKRAQLTAELSALRVQEQRELSAYESRTIEAIAQKHKKHVKETEYAQALRSDYATATAAVNARKADIAANGQLITTDYSGNSTKCELDLENNKLFTFERLTLPEFELMGKTYKVTHAELSPINAGNVYYFQKSN